VLARQAAAAAGVGTCWPWETAATLRRLLGGARRFGAHGGGEERGHIVAAARLKLVYSTLHRLDDDDVMFMGHG